jgi:Holliday junction resolvase RusA-like endonuclease
MGRGPVTTWSAKIATAPRGKERHRSAILWPQVEAWLRNGRRGRKPIAHVYTPADYQRWERDIGAELGLLWSVAGHREPLDEPCSLLVLAYFPRPASRTRKTLPNPQEPHTVKPDASNVVKAVEDALQLGGVLKDDSRIFDTRCVKWVCAGGESPRIQVILRWGADCALLGR